MISVTIGTIDINVIPQKQRAKALSQQMMALLLNEIKVIDKQDVKVQTLQVREIFKKYFHLKH